MKNINLNIDIEWVKENKKFVVYQTIKTVFYNYRFTIKALTNYINTSYKVAYTEKEVEEVIKLLTEFGILSEYWDHYWCSENPKGCFQLEVVDI